MHECDPPYERLILLEALFVDSRSQGTINGASLAFIATDERLQADNAGGPTPNAPITGSRL